VSVITVGDFDGVHLGHRALLRYAVDLARAKNVPAIVITFDQNTKSVLKRNFMGILTEFPEKEPLLRSLGVDQVSLVSFDGNFSNTSGEEFLRYLREEYGCTDLVGGTDFRFGRDGAMQLTDGIEVCGIRQHTVELKTDLVKISSTAIRRALLEGLLDQANTWLGYPFTVTGVVEEGMHLGRTIGFPTLNIVPDEMKILPKNGVYITRARIEKTEFLAMTNVGVRPTVQGAGVRNVETHLLDGNGEYYGCTLSVQFLARLRDEQRFPDMGALMRQLRVDREAALARHRKMNLF